MRKTGKRVPNMYFAGCCIVDSLILFTMCGGWIYIFDFDEILVSYGAFALININ